jgi:hypothetical protein
VPLGQYRRYSAADFHGPRALPLEERGVLVAPPNVRAVFRHAASTTRAA